MGAWGRRAEAMVVLLGGTYDVVDAVYVLLYLSRTRMSLGSSSGFKS